MIGAENKCCLEVAECAVNAEACVLYFKSDFVRLLVPGGLRSCKCMQAKDTDDGE